ncbi:hypothetical protein ACVWYH_000515 [Bradyrhizobium sp. GM24.11]
MGEGAAEQDKAGRAQGQCEGQRRLAQWVRDYRRLPGIPDEFLGADGAPRAVWSRFFDAFGALATDEVERRFGMADRHLREAGVTYRAPGDSADRPLVDQPFAASDRRGRLEAALRRHHPARRAFGARAARRLWRGPAGRRRCAARGRDRRQPRISAPRLRRAAAGRALSLALCRRCRPRARRPLVGARRPHAGAVRRGLCAGEPPGAVARLLRSLQVDERAARRAVLRGVP